MADVNDDGKLDLAVPNSNEDTYTILTQDAGTVVTLSPTRLSFPTQLVGTVSQPKLIALTNEGTATITIGAISAPPNFSQLNNCKKVQPGGSCEIAVYFTPTATGNISGYLTITDNGGGSPQVVPLSGVATIVSLTPTSLDFGSVQVGHVSGAQNVTLTNEGNSNLSISEIGIAGVDGKDFSEVNTCPSKLVAGACCTITVIFHPSAQGQRNGILGVVDGGGGSPQKVLLTGTGT